MEHQVLGTTATMRYAEPIAEAGNQDRETFLKTLHDADQQIANALGQCMSAVENLMNALDQVQKAYLLMGSMGTEHQEKLQYAVLELGKSITETRTAAVEPFMAEMRTFCVAPMQSITTDLNQCEHLKENRTKAAHQYDVNRSIVTNKELDYAKHGKPLTESKHYGYNNCKMEEAKKEYEAAAAEFKQHCDELQTRKVTVTAQTLQAFVHGTTLLATNLAAAMSRVNSTLQTKTEHDFQT
jgi:hypothetical protein